jgi:hypothetical protein
MYGRRYRRSRRSGGSGRSQTVNQQVTQRYFGLDQLIRPMFFKLDQKALSELLRRYQLEYGIAKRDYAEKTYPSWKDGTTKLSGTVVERLILLLPHVLSAEDKYTLVKHLRDRSRSRPRKSFSIQYLNNLITIRDQIKEDIGKDREFALPQAMTEALSWLANNDAKAAQTLLRAVADREARDSLRQLDADLFRLAHVIQNTQPNTSVDFVVDLPQVRAAIYARGALPMSDPNEQKSTSGSGSLPAVQNAGDLLTQSFGALSADDRNKLVLKANDEALRLKVKDLEAKLDGQNADKDITRFLGTTNQVNQQQGIDFNISQSMKTESGQMNIQVKRESPASKPFVWIVLGVVGIIVLILLTRR